jgi:hypothetical protein
LFKYAVSILFRKCNYMALTGWDLRGGGRDQSFGCCGDGWENWIPEIFLLALGDEWQVEKSRQSLFG